MHVGFNRFSMMLLYPMLLLMSCWSNAYAHPVGSNNWHLDSPLQAIYNSDLVCKVNILSVREVGLTDSFIFELGPQAICQVATAKVISIVKGSCEDTIQIRFYVPKDNGRYMGLLKGQLFTELHSGEHCLVFLRHTDDGYFLNRIQSKARVVANPADYNSQSDILIRLLSEFRAGLNAKDEQISLQAVEELGYIGDELMEKLQPFQFQDDQNNHDIANSLKQIQPAIRKACLDQDFIVRSVAVMSSFKLGYAPTIEQAKAILLADPNGFTSVESRSKYGIDDFSVKGLQRSLLSTMDATTRRAIKNLNTGSTIRRSRGIYRGVFGFPYADFYRWALATDIVKNDKELRHSIANVIWIRYDKESIPQMIQLLNDPEQSIRRMAVSALKKCIHDNFSNAWDRKSFYSSGWESLQRMNQIKEKPFEERLNDYQEHEQEYIQYWKRWWSENQERFSKEPRPVSDM